MLRLIGIGALLPRLIGTNAISDGECTIRQIRREHIAHHSTVGRELLILSVKMLTGNFVLLISLHNQRMLCVCGRMCKLDALTGCRHMEV